MLRTYSTNISGTANTGISFNTNKLETSRNVTHKAGSPDISVNEAGYYLVNLDVSYTVGTSGPVTLQLYADNVAIPDAIITAQVVANEYTNSSFNTIIKAAPRSIW